MPKTDLIKELKALYNPPAKEVTLVDVPEMKFIMIDGQGAPESPQFSGSIQALYPIAYAIKFAKKLGDGADFRVMPLEGLFWADDMSAFDAEKGDRNKWRWTLMIAQPDSVTRADFESARQAALKKKPLPLMDKVRWEKFREGNSAQLMHIGPYSAEAPNILKIHQKIAETGGQLTGRHHEIYLSDPRRAAPEKMKTVIRQPYR